MKAKKISVIALTSAFILSSCSVTPSSQSLGRGIGTALIIGGLGSFPKEADKNKDDYDGDKKQSYGLIASGLLLHYLISSSNKKKGHSKNSNTNDEGLTMPKEVKVGSLVYKSKYGGEIRSKNNKLYLYVSNHHYKSGNLYKDNEQDIALHKAFWLRANILAKKQKNENFYKASIYQLKLIENIEKQRSIQKYSWVAAGALIIGGALVISKHSTSPNKTPKDGFSENNMSKDTVKKYSGGVKSIRKRNNQYGKYESYEITCNGGGKDSFYKFKDISWRRIGLIKQSYSAQKDINQLAKEHCR